MILGFLGVGMRMLGSSGGVKGQYQNYIAKISLPRDLCHLFSRTRPDCLDLPGSPQDTRTAWIYQVAQRTGVDQLDL